MQTSRPHLGHHGKLGRVGQQATLPKAGEQFAQLGVRSRSCGLMHRPQCPHDSRKGGQDIGACAASILRLSLRAGLR